MANALVTVISERVMLDSLFRALPSSFTAEIIQAIYEYVHSQLTQADWDAETVDITVMLMTDQIATRQLLLLRSAMLSSKKRGGDPIGEFSGRVREKLLAEREKIYAKVEAEVAKTDEAKPTPNCSVACPGCKEKSVFFTEKQIRASDEPSTIFYLCLSCGKKWKGD